MNKLLLQKFLKLFVLQKLMLLAQFGPRLFLPPANRTNFFIENPLFFEKNIWIRIGTGLVSMLFYLRILIYPYPLLYYYGFDMIPVTNMANFWAILSLLIHLALFIYAISKFHKKRLVSFAILWYLLAVAMYSNFLVPVVGIVGERFIFNAPKPFLEQLNIKSTLI